MSDASITARLGGSNLHPDSSTLGKITDDIPVSLTSRQLNYMYGTLLAAQESSLSDLDLGHPPTPDSQPLICMDKEQNDHGYDCDGWIGFFWNHIWWGAPACFLWGRITSWWSWTSNIYSSLSSGSNSQWYQLNEVITSEGRIELRANKAAQAQIQILSPPVSGVVIDTENFKNELRGLWKRYFES